MPPTRQLRDPVARVAEAWMTLEEDSAAQMRKKLTTGLMEVGEADGVLCFHMRALGSQSLLSDWAFEGDHRVQLIATMLTQKREVFSLTPLNPATTRPIERCAFLEQEAIAPLRYLESNKYYQLVHMNNDIGSQQRLLAYAGNCFVGWLGLLRRGGKGQFTSAHRSRLSRLVVPATSLLAAAHRKEYGLSSGEPADLVVKPDGAVAHASVTARTWLQDRLFVDTLRAEVRRLDSSTNAAGPSFTVRPAGMSILRLDGPEGVRYLVHLAAATDYILKSDNPLTMRQQQVALSASSGLTILEIAAELGLSTGIVHTHLKSVYARLGVSRRVELAHALDKIGLHTG